MKRHGFTLIELLVVIAIISILGAILFPVFATAREKGRQASCASNEKQLGIAFLSYAQDFDEVFAPATGWGASGRCGYDVLIQAYVNKLPFAGNTPNLGVYHCPSDTAINGTSIVRSYAVVTTNVSGVTNFGAGGFTSPANGFSAGSPPNDIAYGCPISLIGTPSATFLLTEQQNNGSIYGSNAGAAVNRAISVGTNYGQDHDVAGKPYHSGGWNYCYCDGHVKWLTPESTVRTPGVSYPAPISIPKYNYLTPGANTTCPGTNLSPCGPWTIADND